MISRINQDCYLENQPQAVLQEGVTKGTAVTDHRSLALKTFQWNMTLRKRIVLMILTLCGPKLMPVFVCGGSGGSGVCVCVCACAC